MKKNIGFITLPILALSFLFHSETALAVDVASTVTALRIANNITGGYMSSTDPLFAQMVAKIQANDNLGAAQIAANSPYFANYLARRLALQMQTPSLDASIGKDNDSTAFLISHFVGGAGMKPSLSTIVSENATYMVNLGAGNVRASTLSAANLQTINWSTALVRVVGQGVNAYDASNNAVATTLPVKHVGGFLTASSGNNDASFMQYGATAGTNLRLVEGIWEIVAGVSLVQAESDVASAADVPRFVPEYNPNFFQGQGQAACISCHGGGLSSLRHGYSAVADVFDFDGNGMIFKPAPVTKDMKSLGSDQATRLVNLACDLKNNPTAVCNPDSLGADKAQGWDLSSWGNTGLLTAMGWHGAVTGQGLNQLGVALGQSNALYEQMTKRVIGEVCPLGIFTQNDVSSIASKANPYATPAGSDDVRTIVALVAANPSCL